MVQIDTPTDRQMKKGHRRPLPSGQRGVQTKNQGMKSGRGKVFISLSLLSLPFFVYITLHTTLQERSAEVCQSGPFFTCRSVGWSICSHSVPSWHIWVARHQDMQLNKPVHRVDNGFVLGHHVRPPQVV
jgi:hypothetical protein